MSVCYAVPGFLLEFLSDLSLYEFRQGEGPKYLTPFALFSYLFLLFITLAIAISRMGVAVSGLTEEDQGFCRSTVRIAALAVIVSLTLGTVVVFAKTLDNTGVRESMLKNWLYEASLIVYFLMMSKMFPLLLTKSRFAFGRKTTSRRSGPL